jgi:hypothetical protein
MTYGELKEIMHDYHMGRISKAKMGCAIHLWQRKSED